MSLAGRLGFLLITGLLGLPTSGHAQFWARDFMFPEEPEAVIFTRDYDLFVASIVAVDDSLATRANPPRVTIRVESVLYGLLKPGIAHARWMPWEPYIPCGVGEAQNIRCWYDTPMTGPQIGDRMILAGSTSQDDWLEIRPKYRWVYSDTLHTTFLQAVRNWMPLVRERRRVEAERLVEAERRKREAAVRAEAELRERETLWLQGARTATRSATISQLVEESTEVLIGEIERTPLSKPVWQPWVRVAERLLTANPHDAPDSIRLYLGVREDSLIARWVSAPPDTVPGSQPGDAVRCIAFLRLAHDSLLRVPWTAYRPVDGLAGLLLADPEYVDRVRDLVGRKSVTSAKPRRRCETGLWEFLNLDSLELVQVAIKLTVSPPDWSSRQDPTNSLVIGTSEKLDEDFPVEDASRFAPCRLPEERYAWDYLGHNRTVLAPCAQMAALLDSMWRIPSLRTPRSDPRDSLLIMIRGESGRHERVYESTLDEETYRSIVLAMADIFAAPPPTPSPVGVGRAELRRLYYRKNLRMRISYWTMEANPGCSDLWYQSDTKARERQQSLR